MISGFEFQPSLSSDTVLLRPLTQDHFAGLQRCAGDLATWADYPTAAVRETGDLSSWFSNGVGNAKALIILDAKTSEIMGTTRYYAVPDEPNAVGIGYTFIGSAFRNSGQTNAVLKQMMFAHAFDAVEAVWFHVLPVVSTGRRNTLIFEQRWSVQYEVSSSHLLFSVTTR
mgnify:CR=1 FL=1